MTTESLPISPTVIVHAEKQAAKRARSSSGSGPQLSGTFWFAGWLFTIGFAHLVWWKALLAIIAWPYFLGITIQ